MSLIETRELWKTYRMGAELVHALQGLSVSIERGEFVAIMGPSGSGKSTFMNLIGCLDTPSKGTYMLNQQNVSQMNDDELARIRNQEIGFIFQTFNLVQVLNLFQNVEFPLLLQGTMTAGERRQRRPVSIVSASQSQTTARAQGLRRITPSAPDPTMTVWFHSYAFSGRRMTDPIA